MARTQCIQQAWIKVHAIKGRKATWNESVQREYIFSASTEKGPVTPKIVNGWIEKRLKTTPHKPVLKTTSMVPQLCPVNTYRSDAKVIPGSRFVKKTYTALAKMSWLKVVKSLMYRFGRFKMSCLRSRNGCRQPSLRNGVKIRDIRPFLGPDSGMSSYDVGRETQQYVMGSYRCYRFRNKSRDTEHATIFTLGDPI